MHWGAVGDVAEAGEKVDDWVGCRRGKARSKIFVEERALGGWWSDGMKPVGKG